MSVKQEIVFLESNIRNCATATVPEHTFALIPALRCDLKTYGDDMAAGSWLSIVGYSALGKAVARLSRAFGMNVSVVACAGGGGSEMQRMPLDDMLATADVISLHLPPTDRTRNVIGAVELAKLKKTASLINTARGGLVDEHSLAAALSTGQIGRAGFDVLAAEPPPANNPLLTIDLPNFTLTPHMAWASRYAMQQLANQLIDSIEHSISGSPRNVVS